MATSFSHQVTEVGVELGRTLATDSSPSLEPLEEGEVYVLGRGPEASAEKAR
jgi:hypothetical protein